MSEPIPDRVPAGVPTGGQFAATTRAEAAVALHPAGAPALRTPLAEALADLPGTVEVTGPHTVTYTDEYGDAYAVGFMRNLITVQAEEFEGGAMLQSLGTPLTTDDVRDQVHQARRRVAETRAVNDALLAMTSRAPEGGPWTHDPATGSLSFAGVTITGFEASDPDFGGQPSIHVHVRDDRDADPAHEGLLFTIARDRTGQAIYRRGDSRTPLMAWEQAALDAEVHSRLTGQATRHDAEGRLLGDLLTDATHRIEGT